MYLSLCYFFIGLGFIIRISVGHQVRSRVADPLAAVSFGSVFIFLKRSNPYANKKFGSGSGLLR